MGLPEFLITHLSESIPLQVSAAATGSIFMSPTESNKTENPSCFAQRNIFPIIYSLSKII